MRASLVRSIYLRCVELYAAAGVDLAAAPLVGLGSVCRRQHTLAVRPLAARLHALGLRLHAFGVKTRGLPRWGGHLASADSMAWSYAARRSMPLPGHPHRSCANCMDFALAWRERLLSRPVQLVVPLHGCGD